MKLSVEFPSVAFREGPEKVREMAIAIESIGYDEIAVFDHVVMGHPTETRPAPMYPPKMPILEAIVMMATIAAVTEHVGISTEVLILPQRQPTLVAKQIATIDTMSGGRVRLGVGVGWQESEYDALEQDFTNRGKRMDEAIDLMRAWWRDDPVDFDGAHYAVTAMAMEPKPPQEGGLPVWIGGGSRAALRRVGERGDGWMGAAMGSDDKIRQAIDDIRRYTDESGRDPDQIGLQLMLAPPPQDEAGKRFYADHDGVVRRAEEIQAMGFEWAAINATAIFQAGARNVDAMIDELGRVHDKLRSALG
ncbi:MAG: LLM class F420-dependent oxidoreductase [Actinomycetia bacterium]|nr:LLM class F420-dependent oxidoreductase [Actinomycetes bacterium]